VTCPLLSFTQEHVFTGDGKAALTAGTAMGITTGAPIPLKADAVVPYEHVTVRDELIGSMLAG